MLHEVLFHSTLWMPKANFHVGLNIVLTSVFYNTWHFSSRNQLFYVEPYDTLWYWSFTIKLNYDIIRQQKTADVISDHCMSMSLDASTKDATYAAKIIILKYLECVWKSLNQRNDQNYYPEIPRVCVEVIKPKEQPTAEILGALILSMVVVFPFWSSWHNNGVTAAVSFTLPRLQGNSIE